jgi:hypothetical protein
LEALLNALLKEVKDPTIDFDEGEFNFFHGEK